jgi:hypothetical protein
MATFNRIKQKTLLCFAILFSFFITCREHETQMNLDEVAKELKAKYCNDPGIFSINPANRFGDNVISIGCISEQDRERVDALIQDPYKGFHIHFTCPIWGIGDLIPKYQKEIEKLRKTHEYNVYGTPQHDYLERLQKEAVIEERKLWNGWSQEEKSKFLNYYIKKLKDRDPRFVNCGDKFIINE